jgi:hypothetical protein
LDQVKKLFHDFEESCGVELEDGIAEHVFAITLGHPGMVCFCGKMMQEILLLTSSTLSLKDWKERDF